MSPTITSPAMMTGAGVLLGTAAYMSPEQAQGREADKRSDTWAFGCVLFEMLTGRRAFEGDDLSDTLANVLKVDPDWSRLPHEVPPLIRTLLQRCLEKDRRRRVADVSTIQFTLALDPSLALGGPPSAPPQAPARSFTRRLAIPGALLTGALAATAMVFFIQRPTPQPVTRLTVSAAGNAAVAIDANDRALAVAPDGSRIAYTGGNNTLLFVRALDQLQPTLMAGPANIREPFFSPDGAWVGFFEPYTRLQKVSAASNATAPSVPATP
jgi:serine/threonine-protein kinase